MKIKYGDGRKNFSQFGCTHCICFDIHRDVELILNAMQNIDRWYMKCNNAKLNSSLNYFLFGFLLVFDQIKNKDFEIWKITFLLLWASSSSRKVWYNICLYNLLHPMCICYVLVTSSVHCSLSIKYTWSKKPCKGTWQCLMYILLLFKLL